MLSVAEQAELVLKQLYTTIQSYDSQMEKLEVDIALVEKEKAKIEGLYRQRLKDFMDELTRTGIEIYENNENAADYFSSRITTKNLYDTVVESGISRLSFIRLRSSGSIRLPGQDEMMKSKVNWPNG